jgi:hypothetical protein
VSLRRASCILVFTACSRSQLDVPSDASVDRVAACDPSAPFVTFDVVAGIASADLANDTDFRLTSDELTAVFVRKLYATSDVSLFIAMRHSVDMPFDAPTSLGIVSGGPSYLGNPSLTDDALTLVFETSAGPDSGFVLHTTSRSSPLATFPPAIALSIGDTNSANHFRGDSYMLPDGNALYFETERHPGYGIGSARRDSLGSFPVIDMVSIDLGVDADALYAAYPVVSADELTLVFERYPLSVAPIWQATRSSIDAPFSSARPLIEFSSDDMPSWISPDKCRLYFAREIASDAGLHYAVHVARR